MRWVVATCVGVGLVALGCNRPLYFACSDDAQCRLAGEIGRCVVDQCAYPDESCESRFSYPAIAPPELAGTCVEPAGTGTTAATTSSTTAPSELATTATGDPTDDTSSSGPANPDMGVPACDVVEISGGRSHTCALLGDGDVYCWGANDALQLGAEGEGTAVPRSVAALDDLDVVSLGRVGEVHACASTADGEVWCWGEQANGAILGGGNSGLYPPTQVTIAAAQRVSVGENFSCAQVGDDVTCWGDTFWGQTGGEMGQGFNTPVSGIALSTLTTGGLHSCGVEEASSQLLCWGRDNHGELGRGTVPTGEDIRGPVPMPVVDLGAVDDVSLGKEHSCAIVDGETWCWGADARFQLLGGGQTSVPRQMAVVPQAQEVELGSEFSCVRTEDGGIHCWGANGDGQADPQTDGTVGLTDVGTVLEALTGAPLVATNLGAGVAHVCAVGDRVVCWGSNDAGQLGDLEVSEHVAVPSLPGCR